MHEDCTRPSAQFPIHRKAGGSSRWKYSVEYEVVAHATVDERDVEFLSDRVWTLAKDTKTDYANHNLWTGSKTIKVQMHREVWERHNGPIPEGHSPDHQDRNGLNNTLGNLRLANRIQQQLNQSLYVNSKTGYKGVCYVTQSKTFQAGIRHQNRSLHLGWWPTAVEGAIAYNHAATFLYGEFPWLNPIPDGAVSDHRKAQICADVERRCVRRIKINSQKDSA